MNKPKSEDNWVDMGDFIVVKDVDLAEDLIGMTKPPESLKGKIIIIAPDGLEFVSIEDLKELPQVKSLISETEDRVREEVEMLKELIYQLSDDEECSFDHHGYCQTHGWMSSDITCPTKRAQELLATNSKKGEE